MSAEGGNFSQVFSYGFHAMSRYSKTSTTFRCRMAATYFTLSLAEDTTRPANEGHLTYR